MIEKNERYSIGTVAALLGISTDTLRHYEKKKLIASRKLPNGYRYYTNEDLRELLCILYYRKMDIGLNHMPVLLQNNSTSSQVAQLLENRIIEEEETIWKHRQNITRLNLMKLQNQRTETYQQGFSIQPFPRSYIIDECSTSQDVIFRWFQRSQETPGLDMAYFYDEYHYPGQTAPASYVGSRLLLYQEVAAVITDSFQLEHYPMTPAMDCVCFSYVATSHQQPAGTIRNMAAWAIQRGYHVPGACYLTNLSARKNETTKTYDMEVYLPVIHEGSSN